MENNQSLTFQQKMDAWSRKSPRRRKLYLNREPILMMTPYFILFFVFTIFPVLTSMVISLTNFNLLEIPKFVGFDNYLRLFVEDDIFLIAIKNTLILAVVTGPIGYIAAFVFAWLINELPNKLRAFMTLVFYAPSISGNTYLIWLLIFSSDSYGYANAMLYNWGLIDAPIQWLKDPQYILMIVILVQLWLSLGVSFLAFIAGLQAVDKSLYEAGAVDGIRNRWQELWYITLPSMKPQLMFGAIIQITSTLSIAQVAMHVAGFPSIEYAGHTIVTHLLDYGSGRFEMGYASTIATVLFVIMICTNLFVRKFLRRIGR